MKKMFLLAILMVAILISAQAQRRYSQFYIGGMSPTEGLVKIGNQLANMEKSIAKLDKKALRWMSRSGDDIVALHNFNNTNNQKEFLVAEIEKLTAQKNELLINNTQTESISVNTKDPVAMATAYYMIKVAGNNSSNNQVAGFVGILVNYWNRVMVVKVTGPGGFLQEITLEPGSSHNPSYQEFEFQIPGDYTAIFSWANGSTPITKKGGWPNTAYTFNGKTYAFKATQLGRF
jgi:hypothetical protein